MFNTCMYVASVLNIPVSDCYYAGTMMDGSGSVAISQCNSDMEKSS